ncbi:acetyltransferase [Haliea sp. E17]|uniref:acetyltransferase n=1 Tax=Haliea sp. E17 TaxID=3401576 RepID=UPI003AAE37D3
MLLRQRSTGHILAVVDLEDLFNVFRDEVLARDQVGEEEQEPEPVTKNDLKFLSGEPLPLCWTDPDYRKRSQSPF